MLGGLAWAIAGSSVDVDVDVFFDEDATMGEKNNCADDICKALARMKCKHALSSFQITRSDWKSVLPVVMWVIATVLETREERALHIRRQAEAKFDKNSSHPEDERRREKRDEAEEFLAEVEGRLGAKRRYRQSEAAQKAGRAREGER